MKPPEIPRDESVRLQSLNELGILDTESEESYDRVTRLASRLFQVPIALVSLVDADRQWFKSRCGLDAPETPRNISFCGHTILSDELMVVPDATRDERFADNPLVTGGPNIRFYAGRPLHTPNGSRIGTLCLIDTSPRDFSREDGHSLDDLADMVEGELSMRLQNTLDELTGISNRRGFLCLAGKYLDMSWRTNLPLSLVYFDLDRFKAINDEHGHAAGDATLREFARVLKANVRESDICSRIGGDEFVALMWNARREDAERSLYRLRECFAEAARDGSGVEIAFSAGIATAPGGQSMGIDELLEDADREMYRDKRERSARALPTVGQAAALR